MLFLFCLEAIINIGLFVMVISLAGGWKTGRGYLIASFIFVVLHCVGIVGVVTGSILRPTAEQYVTATAETREPIAPPALLIGYELKVRPNETWSVDSRDPATGEFKYSPCLLAEGGELKVIYMAEGYALADYQPAADLLGGAAHECAPGTLVMMPEDEFLQEMERSLAYYQAEARQDATRIFFRRVLNGTMEAASDDLSIPVGLMTGKLEFSTPLGGLLPSEPTAGHLPVCATSESGTLQAMAVSYGQVLAKYAVAGPVRPEPYFAACADGAAVVVTAGDFLLNDRLRASKQAKRKAADAFNEWLRSRSGGASQKRQSDD